MLTCQGKQLVVREKVFVVFRACLFVVAVVFGCFYFIFSKSFLLCIAIALRKIADKFFEKIFPGFVNRSNLSELLLKLEICNLWQRTCSITSHACSIQFCEEWLHQGHFPTKLWIFSDAAENLWFDATENNDVRSKQLLLLNKQWPAINPF